MFRTKTWLSVARPMSNSATAEQLELCKKVAAQAAVDNHLIPLLTAAIARANSPKNTPELPLDKPIVFGVGSGSTIQYALFHLRDRVPMQQLQRHLVCIPTSFQSRQLVRELGLPLSDLDQYPRINLTIDGADELQVISAGDKNQLMAIKGGGGAHLQEKIVAFNSRELVIIADYRKLSMRLGTEWKKGIPVEVIPMALTPLIDTMTKSHPFLSKVVKKVTLRMGGTAKAGPCITDNGNFILDVDCGEITADLFELDRSLKCLPGVVETGLFLDMASGAYFGQLDGSVISKHK